MTALDSRPDYIQKLVHSVDRYNPSNCHLLEDYLQSQLADTTYDLLANLALLKLYQFNPSLLSPSSTLSILFLTLVHAPFSPDFSLAWSLLSDSFVTGAGLPSAVFDDDDQEDDDAAEEVRRAAKAAEVKAVAERLRSMSALLAARKFAAFWTALRANEGAAEKKVAELLKESVGVEAALRKLIATEVEQTFKALARSTLESFLGLSKSSSEFSVLATAHGWTIEGETVRLAENESNTPRSTLERECIEIGQLSKLLARSQAV